MKAGPDNMIGVQAGFETGSLRLIGKYADRKLAPYSPDEWHWVVKEGVKGYESKLLDSRIYTDYGS